MPATSAESKRPMRSRLSSRCGAFTAISTGERCVWLIRAGSFDCEEVRVAMTHIGGYPGRYERGVKAQLRLRRPKIFVSGHSHILKVIYDRRNDWLHINPGAAGLSGFHQVRTAVRLTIDGADIRDLEVGEWPRRLKL